ncbi:1-phosphofructokinase family hexose kinase [Alteribacillus sp. HJP-4]|uniref:1-phosphofructokinase family hexose kinase n=1 Tax=Alteribacillus sp. HJP-4 TaxID=2775394 RepID=UPI0035CCD721
MIYTITFNPAIDHIMYASEPLTKRKNNRVSEKALDLGGKGLHVSHALTQLQIENCALTYAGAENEAQLVSLLKQRELRYELFLEQDASTRDTFVLMDSSGEGSLMVTEHGFAVSRETHDMLWQFLLRHAATSDTVILSGSLPPGYSQDRLKEILHLLKEKQCLIACDFSGEALRTAITEKVDFIKPNEQELMELAPSGETVEKQLSLLNKTVRYVVFSRGKRGCTALIDGDCFHVSAPKVKERNDTGAGDIFVGALFAGRERGYSWEQSLAFATGCSASKATKMTSADFDVEEAKMFRAKTLVKITKGVG